VKAPRLNALTFAAIAAGVLIALAVAVPANAKAAPSGIGSAQDAVNELEDNGFNVVVKKVGAAPLDRCTVDSVRPVGPVIRPVQNGTELVNQIVYQTVYLTARC
jgi:hypothetical protein